MSRHSGSSKHRRGHSSTTNNNSEDYIAQSKSVVDLLNEVVTDRPWEWETYLASARSAVNALDHVRFFRETNRYVEQVWLLDSLQDFAFHDPDSGFIQDIAIWCETSWLRILRTFPEDEQILMGLGRNWLQRAQSTIASIHHEEGNMTGSSASPPHDPRRQGPLYVEARGLLQPSVDFYSRAVRAADAAGTITGGLLCSAAEAHMSLGNVTAPPSDERQFAHAIRYLRRAEALPGYILSTYFQQYLEDYGRYVQ